MAKFTVTVDIDWLSEDCSLDDEIKGALASEVVRRISDTATSDISRKAAEMMDEKLEALSGEIGQRMNAMMDDFFDTPRDITDSWGTIKRKDVTARQLIAEAADKFFTERVNENGEPSSYNAKYSRMEYIATKAVNRDVTWAVEKAVKDAVEKVKKTVKDTATKQLGEKLAEAVGLESIFDATP